MTRPSKRVLLDAVARPFVRADSSRNQEQLELRGSALRGGSLEAQATGQQIDLLLVAI